MAAQSGTLPKILINGLAATQVAATDRGLNYGDGVFRTIRIADGRPRWWADHLAKLAEDCVRLGLDCPDTAILDRDLANLAPLPARGVLRLTVTRGEGPRGYRLPMPQHCTRILACWPADDLEYHEEGLTIRVCNLRLGHQAALAGIKHLNRLENVMARAEWNDPAITEGILLDQDGRVISGVMSNLFIWRGGSLQTPRLHLCGVAGVARARLMRRAAAAGLMVEEMDFYLAELLVADEVMLTNSLIGLRRVAHLGERTWTESLISPRLTDMLDA
jgi:4-amino-4-deoxychorismate lyase